MPGSVENLYVIGNRTIPYFANALFTKIGKLGPEQVLDRSLYEFSYPHDLKSFFNIYGMEKDGNRFNTASIKTRTAEIVEHHRETGTPLQIITIVCPPYKKERLGGRKNSGVLTSIEQDPIENGFMYSYKLLAHTLVDTGIFFESLGIKTQLVFVIGDWALRDSLDRPDNYFDNFEETIASLDLFYQSVVEYFRRQYPNVDVIIDRFKGSHVQADLPFVVPQTPELKKQWLKKNIRGSRMHFTGDTNHAMEPFVWAIPQIIRLFETDPELFYHSAQKNQWKEFVPPLPLRPFDLTNIQEVQEFYDKYGNLHPNLEHEEIFESQSYKQVWLSFFQIFTDTLNSRSQEEVRGLKETTLNALEAGFWDACTKMYEYAIYGSAFLKKYPGSLMAYFDTKYPSAAMGYQQAGVDLVYLDTREFYVPKSKLGIYLNPF